MPYASWMIYELDALDKKGEYKPVEFGRRDHYGNVANIVKDSGKLMKRIRQMKRTIDMGRGLFKNMLNNYAIANQQFYKDIDWFFKDLTNKLKFKAK